MRRFLAIGCAAMLALIVADFGKNQGPAGVTNQGPAGTTVAQFGKGKGKAPPPPPVVTKG
jgi:hypothetical protein